MGGIELETSAQAMTEGAVLGLYGFTKYKKAGYEDVEEMLIVVKEEEKVPVIEPAICKGKTIALATNHDAGYGQRTS